MPALLLCILISCARGPSNLKTAFKNDFQIGATLGYRFNADSTLKELTKTHFNVITPENQMKWGPIHPKEEDYNFAPMDTLVGFALQNNIKVIGHTLTWHSQTPGWVFEDGENNPAKRGVLLQRMQNHISTVVSRYNGKIHGYDVVNEAICDPKDGPELLRNSKYLQIIGPDYIEKAFQFARQADPDAQLYYNDYNLANPDKRAKAVELIKSLQNKGVHIDAIGMQGHWNIYEPTVEQVEKSILAYSALGIDVMITEMDISLFRHKDERDIYRESVPDSILQLQARRYGEMFKLFKKHSDRISRVTFWGTTDKYSWLNNWPVRDRVNHPLLFDRGAKPKPAYFAVLKAATEQ